MARSKYIYTIEDSDYTTPTVASFTVKHEMMTFLERNKKHKRFQHWEVIRYEDRPTEPYKHSYMGDAIDLLEEEEQ